MQVLVVMDPVDTIHEDTDTSYALMLAAQQRGHQVLHCLARDVSLMDGLVVASAAPAAMVGGVVPPIVAGVRRSIPLADVDVMLVRPDPPFDHDYLTLTQLLSLHVASGATTLVVNDPRGLRDANEKLWACRFPEIMPPTLVSSSMDLLVDFIATHGGAVLKPIDGHGGRGIVRLLPGDPNARSLIEATTCGGRRVVMAQKFLPGVRDGDKRILLLDGEPLGAILRVPRGDDFRANVCRGGAVLAASLDADDEQIIDRLAPALRADGLWFVGIDVIAGHLTEVNVTSPTGIQQLASLSGGDPAATVIRWLEDRSRG